MAKSKKSKGFRLKSGLVKMMGLTTLALGATAIWNPAIIPWEPVRRQVLEWREVWLGDRLDVFPSNWPLGEKLKENFLVFAKNIKLPKQVTGLPESTTVEEAVIELQDKIKALPQEKVHQIKQDFCADLMDETEQVAGTTTTP